MRHPLAALLSLPLTMAAAAEGGVIHHLRAAGEVMPYYWDVRGDQVPGIIGSIGEADSSVRFRGGYTAQFELDADVSTLVGVHIAQTSTEDDPVYNTNRSSLSIDETVLLGEVGVAATPASWFACEFAFLLGGGIAESDLNGASSDQGWVVEGDLVIRPVVIFGPIEVFGEAGYSYRVTSIDYDRTGLRTDAKYRIDGLHGGFGAGWRF